MKVAESIKAPVRIAAKAGFITKRVWTEFFAHGNRRWRDRQWKTFLDDGIFRQVPDYGFVDSAVTLTEKGNALAAMLGHDPVFSPPAKNLWHDEELIRLALYLEQHGFITNFMTEQELKLGRAREKFFRGEMRPPKIPDLIIEWRRPAQPVLWAIELERTRKEFSRYYDMVGSYRGISNIDSVLVIAATNSIEANIKKAQAKLNYSQDARPMFFASMDAVIRDPGSSEIRMGQKRMTLTKIAHALVGAKVAQMPTHGIQHSPSDSLNRAMRQRAV